MEPFRALKREQFTYTSQYCEENVYLLAQQIGDTELRENAHGWVVFVSNPMRQTPVWCQKACKQPEAPVVWDYHVIYIAEIPNEDGSASSKIAFDLDTTLTFPCDAIEYFHKSFRPRRPIPAHMQQVVSAREFLDHFASDRSHMLVEGGVYLAAPPSYEPIKGALATSDINLDEYVDMTSPKGGEANPPSPAAPRGVLLTRYEFEHWLRGLYVDVTPPH